MSKGTCSVFGCGKPAVAVSMCGGHYKRAKANDGDPGPSVLRTVSKGRGCEFEGCERKHSAYGLCAPHRVQQSKGKQLVAVRPKSKASVKERNAAGEKQCGGCQDWLPEGEYYRSSGTPDGLFNYCRGCSRANGIYSRHRIRPEQFTNMLSAQGGSCAICKVTLVRGKNTHVDHDHACCPGDRSCGECVRGLLCGLCNASIGMMADDPKRLRAAADYLERG